MSERSEHEDLSQLVERARAKGDFAPLLARIPYYAWLGLRVDVVDGDLLVRMPPQERLIGNPVLPALHGGTIGALLESAGTLKVFWEAESPRVPKTISITVDYLRSGALEEVTAKATITRLGRRVANVQVRAWQADSSRPIAAAHAHFLLRST